MGKRVFAFLLAFVMLFHAVPSQAFAAALENSGITEFCATEGCTLKAEEHTECVVPSADPEPTVYCTTEGCSLQAGPHDLCVVLSAQQEQEPTVYCETEGCTLKNQEHTECVLPPADQQQEQTAYCETEGCTLKNQEHTECAVPPADQQQTVYCETEGCTLKNQEHTECVVPPADQQQTVCCETEGCTLKNQEHSECVVPPADAEETKTTYCDNEGCLLRESAEHETCEFCTTAGCRLQNLEAHTQCQVLVKAAPRAVEDPDKPTSFKKIDRYGREVNQNVYIAVYLGDDFPGEPAWYGEAGYTFFNSRFQSGMSAYSGDAANVLNPEILNQLVQGPTTDNGVKVWGYYNASGTRNMIIDSNLLNRANEETIIRTIKGNSVNVNDYKIIWYVIKYQTDTDWHIDGLIVPVDAYNVNYYAPDSTSGGAPFGETGLKTGETHTVSDNVGNLEKVVGGQQYTFIGWKDEAGTDYKPGEVIKITNHDISLYAQWAPPQTSVTVTKLWSDNNDELGIRSESVTVRLMNGTTVVDTVELSEANSWTHKWSNLDAVDSNGNLITYTVAEESVLGYTTSYSGSQGNGYTVTNTIVPGLGKMTDEPGRVVITGQKIWYDKNNEGNTRPDSITVILKANDTQIMETTASAPNWIYSFDISAGIEVGGVKLDPNDVTFTIDEVPVTGYTKSTVVNPEVTFSLPGTEGDWYKQSPCSNLDWVNSATGKTILVAKMKGNNPVLVWTPDPLSPFERDLVEASVRTINEVSSGSLTIEYLSGQGASSYGLTVDSDSINFSKPSDWAQFFTGTYHRGASNSTISSIANVRSDYQISVTKVWNDDQNRDGKRPESVTVHLVDSNGKHAGTPLTLNAGNNWTGSWNNVVLYDENNNLISYTVIEEAVTNYTTAYSGTADTGFTVTNSYTPATRVLNVRKAWDDANNQDNIRPTSVSMQLYANDVIYGTPLVLQQSTSFTGQWQNLPVYQNGEEIQYTVKEVGTVDGYTVSESVYLEEENLWRITNRHETAKTSVSVTKKWEDAENQDGIRPLELYVTLFQNGVATKTLILNDANAWTGSFSELEVNHGIGVPNVYTVHETGYKLKDGTVVSEDVETVPPGYAPSHSGSQEAGFVITNTHTPENTTVYVKKAWSDNHNQDGIRPAAVEITLYADGVTTGKKTILSDANGWNDYFTGLPKYKAGSNGQPISYTVKETGFQRTASGTMEATVEVSGKTTIPTVNDDYHNVTNVYEASITATTDINGIAGYEVTNSRTPDTAILKVVKAWADNDDADKMRPYAVEITMLENGNINKGTLVLHAGNSWTGTWPSVPKFHNGQRISYSILETGYYLTAQDLENGNKVNDLPAGYGVSRSYVNDAAAPTATITNTYNPTRTALNVQKAWEDGENRDNLRPGSIQVQLRWRFKGEAEWNLVDNTTLKIPGDYIQTLSPATEWDADFENLPIQYNHRKVEYSVVEVGVPDEYTVSYGTTDEVDSILITNTYAAKTTYVTVTKDWQDANNQDGIRPENITVTLLANGDEITTYTDDKNVVHQGVITLSAANGWKHTFENLPLNQAGKEITYSVKETAISGYTTEVKAVVVDATAEAVRHTDVTVTNTHAVEKIRIPVYKVWADQNNNDGKRPESITVTLYQGNTAVASKDLTIANGFSAVFEDLDKMTAGVLAQYSVKETAYKMKLSDTEVKTIAADATAPDGYVAAIVPDKDEKGVITRFTITNTHTPETVTVSASKIWEDEDDQDGERPTSIELHLLKNGEHTNLAKTVQPDSNGVWGTIIWEDLPKYEQGYQIKYTVTERAVSDYTTTYSHTTDANSGNITATITNIRTPDKRAVTVEKMWNDAWNQDDMRPDSVTVQLYANGQPVTTYEYNGTTYQGTATLTRENNWIHSFVYLDVNENQNAITYSVQETSENVGYWPTYNTDDKTGDLEIINHHLPEQIFVEVKKEWKDENNRDGIRPESIEVTLYKNGEKVDKYGYWQTDPTTGKPVYIDTEAQKLPGVITLSAANNWTYRFEKLDKYHGIGELCDYDVVETGYTMPAGSDPASQTLQEVAPGYTAEVTGTQDTGYTITNSHTPDVTSLYVKKTWNDNHDQDGIRPYAVEMTLYADETETEHKVTLSNANGWEAYFPSDLPVHRTGAVGQKINYTVKETGYQRTSDSSMAPTENGNTTIPTVAEGHIATNVYVASITATTDGKGVAGYQVTNSRTPDVAKLTVTKSWVDNNDNNKMRPFAIEVTLLENGLATEKTLILKAANSWTGSWENMPKFRNGQRISYSVKETGYYLTEGAAKVSALPSGYAVTHAYNSSDLANPKTTITNTYNPEILTLNVQKNWDDADNQDGIRPASITVNLRWRFKGETAWNLVKGNGGRKVMSPATEWDADFDNLPRFYDHKEVEYSAAEVVYDEATGTYVEQAPDGYVMKPSDKMDAYGSFVITNTHVPAATSVIVTKHWDDANDQDGLRPEKITVTLLANGDVVTDDKDQPVTAELTAADGWTYTFKDLPLKQAGKEIVYSVKETPVPGYTSRVISFAKISTEDNTTVRSTELILTNTHVVDTMDIPVHKHWEDQNNNDDIRPQEITVTLLADGVKTATAKLNVDNDFHFVFTGMPVNRAKTAGTTGKQPIVYTLTEESVEGYRMVDDQGKNIQSAVMKDGKIVLINKHDIELVDVTAAKVWNDGNDQDGVRPKAIRVHLFADGVDQGEAYVKTLRADENGVWQPLVWKDLPKYAEGKTIRYTVYESVEDLRIEPVTKTKAPGGEGTAVPEPRIADRYVASYRRLSSDEKDPNFYALEMTNTYVPETTEVSVAKVWKDDYDRDGIRPKNIVVHLLADGVDTGKTVTLNPENEWHASFAELPKYKDHGKEIDYSVTEEIVEGYKASISEDEHIANRFVITNTHDPVTTKVQVTKHWSDDNNKEGLRPYGIIVQLMANSSYVQGATAVLSQENGWKHTFAGTVDAPLYVFQNVGGASSLIQYSVLEVGYVDENGNRIPGTVGGYVADYVVDGYTVQITNTLAFAKKNISVEKKWDDANDKDGFRTDHVKVTLMKDGIAVKSYVDNQGNEMSGTVILSEENGWKHTWNDVEVSRGGKPHTYTVQEELVEGYEAVITGSVNDGFVITNVHVPEVWKTSITKVWKDNGYFWRPSSVTVQLYKNGVAYGDSFKIRARDGWEYPVELPVYENGERITWKVLETHVPYSYEVSYNQNTLTITNKLLTADSNPGTGDSFNLGLWSAVMGISGAGALVLLFLMGKKKKSNKNK